MAETERVQEIIHLIRDVRCLLHRGEGNAWANLNLFSISQLKALFVIHYEGTTNAKTVAERIRVTSSNLTGILDHLVKLGLVSRQENPANRRMYDLQLTEKGEDVVTELRTSSTEILSRVLSRMSDDDLAALIGILHSLQEVAEADRGNS